MSYHHRIGAPFSDPLTTFLAHGYLAVDLFFVLSGFVMGLTYSHLFASGVSRAAYLRFLGRRIARIYPLYSVATLIGFFLVVIGWLEAPQPGPRGVTLALNLIMVQAWGLAGSFDGPAWSISAEWAAYLIFPILIILIKPSKQVIAWIGGLASVAVLAVLCTLPAASAHHSNADKLLDFYGWYQALPVLRCVSEFVLGIIAFRIFATPFGRWIGSGRWTAPIVCLSTLALAAIPRTDLGVVLLFPLVIVGLASGTSLPAGILTSAPAQLVGRLSYSIYLVHELLTVMLRSALGFSPHSEPANVALLTSAFSIALTLPIAFLLHGTIEVHGRRWLRIVFDGSATNGCARANARPT